MISGCVGTWGIVLFSGVILGNEDKHMKFWSSLFSEKPRNKFKSKMDEGNKISWCDHGRLWLRNLMPGAHRFKDFIFVFSSVSQRHFLYVFFRWTCLSLLSPKGWGASWDEIHDSGSNREGLEEFFLDCWACKKCLVAIGFPVLAWPHLRVWGWISIWVCNWGKTTPR